MEQQYQIATPGTSLQTQDLNLLGTVSAHVDDYVLDELLRMRPMGFGETGTATIARAIIPWHPMSDVYQDTVHGQMESYQDNGGTVSTSGRADGTIHVRPFRAIIGSRAPISAGNELTNYRDIRSTVFTSSGTSTLHKAIQITANGSTNPRWDLVYVAVTPDTTGSQVTRNVKNPTSGVITQANVVQTLITSLNVMVQTGTAGATPALPTIPVDGGGIYYIPLAYVLVAGSFNGTSTIPRQSICHASPCKSISQATGVSSARPASSISDIAEMQAGASAGSWGSSGTRPPWMIPGEMVGKKTLLITLDTNNATTSNWSHQNGGIVDDSIDWSTHFFRWTAHIGTGSGNNTWAADAYAQASGSAALVPSSFALQNTGRVQAWGHGQTFVPNDIIAANNYAFAMYLDANCGATTYTGSVTTALPTGAAVGLYVKGANTSSYKGGFPLRAYIAGAPNCKIFILLEAFGPYPAYGY